MENLKSIVEAIFFASDPPISPKQIKDIINEPAKKFSSNGETGKLCKRNLKQISTIVNGEFKIN